MPHVNSRSHRPVGSFILILPYGIQRITHRCSNECSSESSDKRRNRTWQQIIRSQFQCHIRSNPNNGWFQSTIKSHDACFIQQRSGSLTDRMDFRIHRQSKSQRVQRIRHLIGSYREAGKQQGIPLLKSSLQQPLPLAAGSLSASRLCHPIAA